MNLKSSLILSLALISALSAGMTTAPGVMAQPSQTSSQSSNQQSSGINLTLIFVILLLSGTTIAVIALVLNAMAANKRAQLANQRQPQHNNYGNGGGFGSPIYDDQINQRTVYASHNHPNSYLNRSVHGNSGNNGNDTFPSGNDNFGDNINVFADGGSGNDNFVDVGNDNFDDNTNVFADGGNGNDNFDDNTNVFADGGNGNDNFDDGGNDDFTTPTFASEPESEPDFGTSSFEPESAADFGGDDFGSDTENDTFE
jgi:hypothetical protein